MSKLKDLQRRDQEHWMLFMCRKTEGVERGFSWLLTSYQITLTRGLLSPVILLWCSSDLVATWGMVLLRGKWAEGQK